MKKQVFKVGDVVSYKDVFEYGESTAEYLHGPFGEGEVKVVVRAGSRGRVTGYYVEDARLGNRHRYLTPGEDAITLATTAPAAAPAPAPAQVTPETTDNPKKKFGATKPDLSLVPPVGTLHQAMSHELGAFKYGAYNWRASPVEAMTYIGAIERHIQAYKDGEEYSSDSEGMCHNLGAIMASCAILLDSMELGILKDNRPLPGKASDVQNRLQALKVEQAKRRAQQG